MKSMMRATFVALAVLALWPAAALAQEGQIAGTVRDNTGGAMPGVLVEVTSPQLIEKVRAATTDRNGQYRLTNLPVGTYTVTFTLEGFSRQQRDNVVLTTGFTAPVNATMAVGQLSETVVVAANAPTVDVQNARQAVTFEGETLRELPTARNINSLLNLTPGISSNYRPGAGFGSPGVCVGGVGVFCNPSVNGFNVGDTGGGNLSQGRVMVDGQVVNNPLPVVGQTGGFTADIANAQEINIQLSGALGESETGGASINIVPRTGGNRYAGEYNTTYTRGSWFDQNVGNYPQIEAVTQDVISDHDISGAFGGPILRDRLWFYSVGRTQGIHKRPRFDMWPNLHEGKWGYNYQPDRSQPRVEYKNIWRNLNARLTWQATQRNKFNLFWDEQDFCQDPCLGVVSGFTSPESWWSVQVRPNRLQQASWTNPLTNRVLLEAGLSVTSTHYDTTRHREYTDYTDLPRISEAGTTVGKDEVSSRLNDQAGGFGASLTSGPLNSGLGGGAELRNGDTYRSRASGSYVTGSHNVKIGYEGAYFTQKQTNKTNAMQLQYNYDDPSPTTCPSNPVTCGVGYHTSPFPGLAPQFPNDPQNLERRPVPVSVTMNTGVGTIEDKVMYAAFYAQDQWTLNRFTISGALRYDHATSEYGSTCVGPNQFVLTQWCTPEADGVDYKDITPRWGVVWDVFGTGRTAVKWNMGKYLNAAGISGIYSNANAARRTVNNLTRNWRDANGNRVVDCNLMNFDPNGECTGFAFGSSPDQFGVDPATLDASGEPVGLQTIQCGRTEAGIPAEAQAYCAADNNSLIEGWRKRPYEWQFGLGVQHEILPRLSGEVTYNRRSYGNRVSSDQLNIGCDRYNGAVDVRTCQEANLNYTNPSYDFYSYNVPSDPRLPGGGGYTVLGLNTLKTSNPTGQPTVQTINPDESYVWNGVDTNFVWRGPFGIRINGGTSTGRTHRDTCFVELDGPDVQGRNGAEYRSGCRSFTPFQTNVRGSAAYVIPWADVLISTVFQSLPGVEQTANFDLSKDDPNLVWGPNSLGRAIEDCDDPDDGRGCFGANRDQDSTGVNLLLDNEFFGERVTVWDLKLAKNIRFLNKRATIGADIYNVFNSDAVTSYNGEFHFVDDPTTDEDDTQLWGQPTGLVSPRFVRFSIQFSF